MKHKLLLPENLLLMSITWIGLNPNFLIEIPEIYSIQCKHSESTSNKLMAKIYSSRFNPISTINCEFAEFRSLCSVVHFLNTPLHGTGSFERYRRFRKQPGSGATALLLQVQVGGGHETFAQRDFVRNSSPCL